jgi:hypothetical protein
MAIPTALALGKATPGMLAFCVHVSGACEKEISFNVIIENKTKNIFLKKEKECEE